MKHQIHTGGKLGRSGPQRNAMRKTMITQVIEHERIQTTKAKAKYIRADLEKLITLAKHGLVASALETPAGSARFVNARRLAAGRLNDPEMVRKLFDTIAPRYAKRPGGYTRILRLGLRKGDSAEMVLLEMVEE
jgi:large subunit ribosomal protein L17